MGISLYKAIGYGVELTVSQYETIMSSYFLSGDFYDDDLTLEQYFRWTLTQPESDNPFVSLDRHEIKQEAMEDSGPHSCVVSIENSATGNQIIMILPPGQKNKWERYEDTLDMVESKVNKENPVNSVEVTMLDQGIYPYDTMWMNQKTGELLNQQVVQRLPFIRNAVEAGVGEGTDAIVREFYPDTTSEQLLANIVPAVPENIRLFSRWLSIFKDDDFSANLRPMFIKTWR